MLFLKKIRRKISIFGPNCFRSGTKAFVTEVIPLIGLRFLNVNVLQGAAIKGYNIQFTADSSNGSEPVDLTIYGEATDDSATYTEIAGNLSARTETTQSVVWTITAEWSTNDKGEGQRTAVLSAIVLEIIDSPTWV